MKIEWRDVPGYNGLIQASSDGRVRRLRHNGKKIHYYSPTISRFGYLRIHLRVNGANRLIHLHRLVAMAFLPNTRNCPQVNHIDGNKLNNNVNNLEWCTCQENCRHREDVVYSGHHKGGRVKGKKYGSFKNEEK